MGGAEGLSDEVTFGQDVMEVRDELCGTKVKNISGRGTKSAKT